MERVMGIEYIAAMRFVAIPEWWCASLVAMLIEHRRWHQTM
jgi:hypothetical protein